MSRSLSTRTPELSWAHAAAHGELEGLGWVDLRPDPELADAQLVKAERVGGRGGERGPQVRYRHRSHLRFLPETYARAAIQAHAKGKTTAWDGLALLFSRADWLVRSRAHLWAPHSPAPRLLATLVQTFGIEAQIHLHQPERLARLCALLPSWYPGRGTLDRARQLLAICEEGAVPSEVVAAAPPADAFAWATSVHDREPAPAGLRLDQEILACRTLSWWEQRGSSATTPFYRITGGLLRFQPADSARFALRAEDVLIGWTPGAPLAHHAVRLLPAWTVFRLTTLDRVTAEPPASVEPTVRAEGAAGETSEAPAALPARAGRAGRPSRAAARAAEVGAPPTAAASGSDGSDRNPAPSPGSTKDDVT